MIDLKDWAASIKIMDDVEEKGRRVLVYGDTGSGKTRFAGTAPGVFIIDCDKGLRTLQGLGVDYITIPYDEPGAINLVRDIVTKFKNKEGVFDGDKYLTLVIDSYTSLSDIVMNELMKYPLNPSWKKRDPVKDKPEYDHWGAHKAFMVEVSNMLKDISIDRNVICTATAFVKENEAMRQTQGLPEIQGSFKSSAGKFFDYVFYLTVESSVYNLYTKKKGLFIAKTRSTLKDIVADPTWDKVFV